MLHTVVISLLAALAGLWAATEFVPGVAFEGDIKKFLIAALILGIIVAVLRPVLNLLSSLVKLAVLFGAVLLALWALDIFFPEFAVPNLTALLWTGLAVTAAVAVLSLFARGKV